ncbi:MAG: hypothetical protein CM15mV101_020 [uncultured marine virus]|nr:MAG: hypothetical protein CM15mV101_020 [uncultured marine virus]
MLFYSEINDSVRKITIVKSKLPYYERGFVDACCPKKKGVSSCPSLHFDSTIVDTKTVPTSVSRSTPKGNAPLDEPKNLQQIQNSHQLV